MKIGITSIGYESKDLLSRCFDPWNEIKNDKSLCPEISDIKICFSHGCFDETHKLGFPIYSTDGTCELAREMQEAGKIDDLIIYDSPQKEYDMWTNNLTQLKKHGVDLLIMVNVDELWEIEEIKKFIKFVERNNLVDYFKVNFKNYCINYSTWVDDFIVPRAWFVNRNKGLKKFYRDELVEYDNGKKDIECSSLTIPRALVFPKHYSWVGTKEYLQRKLRFQALRYGPCSYEWDELNNCLKLNDSFYLKYNVSRPILSYD